jgi:hypothetical protein
VTRSSAERGQATAETAVVMVVVVVFLLLLAQGAVAVRDKVAVVHAARDAAREASVGTPPERITAIVHSLLPAARVRVTPSRGVGSTVAVEVSARVATSLPIVGPLLPDFVVRERVTMRAER